MKTSGIKVLIAAGSSGGHIFPAVATASKIKELDGQSEIIFVGSKKLLDGEIFKNEGYKYYTISSNRRIFKDLISSFLILRKFKPDIAMGFGGYVSFPVLTMARLLGISTMTHEQNLFPGFANRLLANFVNRVAVSFKETNRYFSKKSILEETGNPIRSNLVKLDRDKALEKFGLNKNKFTLLVMGGSQGAHFVNEIVLSLLKDMDISRKEGFQVIHLTGIKDFEFVKREYSSLSVENRTFSFFDMMSQVYSAADLILSRAGATSIAEITFFGKPAILIPYPNVKVHQIENARLLEKNGAAIVIEQVQLSKERLKGIIFDLMNDKPRRQAMSQNSARLSTPDAAYKLAREVLDVVRD